MNFKQILNERRKKLNMTQRELADKLNVSDKTISKWETGVNFPDLRTLNQLAQLLGVSVSDLLEADDLKEPEIREERNDLLIARFKSQQIAAYVLFLFSLICVGWGSQVSPWIVLIGLMLMAVSLILFSVSFIAFRTAAENSINRTSFDYLTNNFSLLFFDTIFLFAYLTFMALYPANVVSQLVLIAFQVVPMFLRKKLLRSNNFEVIEDKITRGLTRTYWSTVVLGNLIYGVLMTGWIQSDNRLFIAFIMIMTNLFILGTPVLGMVMFRRNHYTVKQVSES